MRLRKRRYIVVFSAATNGWAVRGGSGWGPVLSSHATQQAAVERAKEWAKDGGGIVRCEDRQGRVQWTWDAWKLA